MTNKILTILLCFFSAFAFSHGDEDHGAAKKVETSGKDHFTVNSASGLFELVLRYHPVKANEKSVMQLFVSDFATNKPIDGKITVSSIDGDVRLTTTRVDSGIYTLEGTFPANKEYTLAVNVV